MISEQRSGVTPAIVITGMGAVTVFGDGCASLFDGLRAGRSGIHELRDIPVARGKDRSGQITHPRRTGPWRLSEMAVDAAVEAVMQAGWVLSGSGLADSRGTALDGVTGLYVATTGGDSRALEDRYGDFLAARQALADARCPEVTDELAEAMVRFPTGALADLLATRLRLTGPRYVATNACASGSIAMAMALMSLRRGIVDRAVVVGADQLKATSYWGAERSGFIGHDLRPFHAERDGSVLGDGAGALVLEPASTAARRGARPLAQLAGWGITCDDNPQAIVPPEDGAANAEAIRLALADAAVPAREVDYFNAHGTGTPLIDRLETTSAKAALGDQAYRMAMSSTKSFTGHLAAASPIIEAIATVYCLEQQWVHPTAKLDRVDPQLDLDYVPLQGRPKKLRAAVSNSLGGGGTNTVVVLRAWPGGAADQPRRTGSDPAAEAAIVVTGTGAVSRLGDGVRCLGQAHGFAPVPDRPTAFSVLDYIAESAGYHHLSRTAQLGYGAAAMAMADAGITLPLPTEGPLAARRVAVVVGTAVGGLFTLSDVLCPHLLTDPKRITPNMALDHGPQLVATLIARAAASTGPLITLTTGVTAGMQAVEVGRWLLTADACDVVVVAGAEAADEPMRDAARLLARRRGHPAPDSFAAELTDGAGCLVLERAPDAQRRGARAKATVTGCASWGSPAAPGELGASATALAWCLGAVLASIESEEVESERPHLSYHVGGGAAELASHKIINSGFRSELLGQSLAATPMLATVAAVEQADTEPDALILVSAVAPGGAAAALRLQAVRP